MMNSFRTWGANLLDPIFGPLLNLDPLVAIVILALFVSLVITLTYKYLTDQKKMKALKDEMKSYQKKMKEQRSNPEKMMSTQKLAMEKNMQYFKMSMKPTLITMIPIILIFGWIAGNLAYEPISPGEEFTMTATFNKGITGEAQILPPNELTLLSDTTQDITEGEASWTLSGEAGEYIVQFGFNDQYENKAVEISYDKSYEEPLLVVKDSPYFKSITTSNDKLIVLNLFGWKLGWLGSYIIFSIVFSMVLRKVMKIY